jgi:threonine aldolase
VAFHPPEFRRQFASDNLAGICPESLAALVEANTSHAPSYGGDAWTAEATRLLREIFETDCEVFLVFNGTAANSLSLASLCQPFESVLCYEHAHIATDECGAPGFIAHGTTRTPIPGEHGKLTPEAVTRAATGRRDVHHPKAGAVSLTLATELGTVYSVEELTALSATARQLGLTVHMDGARFANAVAGLGAPPRAITWEAGIDVLSLGGTKNGLPFGEAVVFFNRAAARLFEYRRKQSGQLASKMRFLAAPWVGALRNGAWLRHATHANAMAADLEHGLGALPGVQIAHPREANAVFVSLPPPLAGALRAKGWLFYTDVDPGGAARLMCSWDTTREDVAAFVHDATTARP